MKKAAIVLTLFIFFSFTPKEEVLQTRTVVTPPPAPEPVIAIEPELVIPPYIPRYEEQIRCEDNTRATFNSCGLDILPFLRTAFFDMYNDGIQEMIVGSKDGTLRLYKNTGTTEEPAWKLIE